MCSILQQSPLYAHVTVIARFRSGRFSARKLENIAPGRRGASPKFPPIFGAKSYDSGPCPPGAPRAPLESSPKNPLWDSSQPIQPTNHSASFYQLCIPRNRNLDSTTTTRIDDIPISLPILSSTQPHTMAALIKAANAKIRSNPVTDYICSTRTYL